MKTIITKFVIAAVTIIGVVAVVTLSAHAARTVGRHHSLQPKIEIITVAPSSYGEAVNNLFGR